MEPERPSGEPALVRLGLGALFENVGTDHPDATTHEAIDETFTEFSAKNRCRRGRGPDPDRLELDARYFTLTFNGFANWMRPAWAPCPPSGMTRPPGASTRPSGEAFSVP